MEFDFEREYAYYSNADLLRIVLQQHLYQPAAVAMAEAMLQTRVVTDEDHRLAEDSIRPKARPRTVPVANTDWQPGDDIFASVAPPVTFERIRGRWLMVLIALGVLALYSLYNQARIFTNPYALRYTFGNWSGYFGLGIIALELSSGICFYLKQRRGWVLTAVYVCYMLLSNVVALLALLYFHAFSSILAVLIKAVLFSDIALLVWSPEMRSFYDADVTLMRRTTIITASVCVAYFICINAWFYLHNR